MASRLPSRQICQNLSRASLARFVPQTLGIQKRCLATPTAHPVTQDETSRYGPTAMVFMNMGGPSTTDEVGDFLSRLFVRRKLRRHRASDA
jgi:ferrochelatase